MIQGKLIEYGQDLTDVEKVWNEVYKDDDNRVNWNEEIAVYGVIHDDLGNPLAAGRLTLDNGRYILSKIAVLEEERKKGYGDFLVRLLVNKAFMSGANCVYVTVNTEVREFFSKLGFENKNKKSTIQNLENMVIFTNKLCRKCSKK